MAGLVKVLNQQPLLSNSFHKFPAIPGHSSGTNYPDLIFWATVAKLDTRYVRVCELGCSCNHLGSSIFAVLLLWVRLVITIIQLTASLLQESMTVTEGERQREIERERESESECKSEG